MQGTEPTTVTSGSNTTVNHTSTFFRTATIATTLLAGLAAYEYAKTPSSISRNAKEGKPAAKAPASVEKDNDPLSCVLDTTAPDFQEKYDAFLKSDPADIRTIPDGPLELGKGVYMALSDGPKKGSLQKYTKGSLTFPTVDDPCSPIIWKNKGFIMCVDATFDWLQVRTLSAEKKPPTEKRQAGIENRVKAGIFPERVTFTSMSQLEAMCLAMDQFVPPSEPKEKPDQIGKHVNGNETIWFHHAALPEPQTLAADMDEPMDEKAEAATEAAAAEMK